MSIEEQGRTRFIKALSSAINVPESEIRLRIRSVSEAGLLQKSVEPFLDRHGANILIALLASPRHAEAGRIVQRYAALPFAGFGGPEEAPVNVPPRDVEAIKWALPDAFEPGATLGGVLAAILRDMREGELNAPYFVRGFSVSWPPHDAVTIHIEPVGIRPPIPLYFAAQHGLDARFHPLPAMEHSVKIPPSVLIAVAPFTIPSTERKSDESGATATARRGSRRAKHAGP